MELLFKPLFMKGKADSLEFVVEESPNVAFQRLIKEDNILAYLPKYLGGVPENFHEKVYFLPAKHSIPVGMFFRRDKGY